MTPPPARHRVLFLCTGNSCRSQMAEGWARHLLPDRVDACSAGTDPHGLNPLAVRAMAEAGVDISGHESTTPDACDPATLDLVVTVCGHAHEQCPVLLTSNPRTRIVHHGFDDPPRLARESGAADDEQAMPPYRRVRDEIRDFVAALPELLAEGPPPMVGRAAADAAPTSTEVADR